jgi:hypothetical protein
MDLVISRRTQYNLSVVVGLFVHMWCSVVCVYRVGVNLYISRYYNCTQTRGVKKN